MFLENWMLSYLMSKEINDEDQDYDDDGSSETETGCPKISVGRPVNIGYLLHSESYSCHW